MILFLIRINNARISLFFFNFFIITISTIGYGFLFIKLVKYKPEETNLGLIGLLGLFFCNYS